LDDVKHLFPLILDPKHLEVDPGTPLLRSAAMVLWSFLAGLACVVAGLALVVVRAVALWRQAKRAGRAFAVELSSFDERSARTERLLGEAERASKDLEAALERLRVSRARLDVLRGSLERSAARTRWLRAFLPV
jgi:hypothetical protein